MESQTGFHLPLLLEVKPSRLVERSILALHWLAPVPLLYSAMDLRMILPVAVLLVFNYRYLLRHGPGKSCTIVMRSNGEWLLGVDGRRPDPVALLPGSFVHPLVTVLRFRHAHTTTSVILTRDNVPPYLHRRLRVLLRLPPGT